MNLTNEQILIINSQGNIKINAVAGSGKTTSLIHYAKARPEKAKILYLAFNKSVKLEAERKFTEQKLYNVDIETAHSLAYRHIVRKNKYSIKSEGYKLQEIIDLLNIKPIHKQPHSEFIFANHINKFLTYFCNQAVEKVKDINYLDVVSDIKARNFVGNFYSELESYTRQFLAKMNNGEIPIIHDFYLKKFQLSKPKLHYDFFLFDEGQDASPVMLDVFLNQVSVKVIVGDANQQIYTWRYAVNALQQADFKHYELSTSFRFDNNIAFIAHKCLELKKYIDVYDPITIRALGGNNNIKTKATLARTNLGLLRKAIKLVGDHEIRSLYFEGNINSYAYASEGATIYDVLNLYNSDRHLIKNAFIKRMKSFSELQEYVENAEDREMKMLIDIVIDYKSALPRLLKDLKQKHVGDSEKNEADMIFSTVHRCKGMEYDEVTLEDDFICKEDIIEFTKANNKDNVNKAWINEEINILYVAVTRTRNMLNIPEKYLSDFDNICIIKSVDYINKSSFFDKHIEDKEEKSGAYSYEEKRKVRANAYKSWTNDEDDELEQLFCEGLTIKQLTEHFQRNKGTIQSRIKKLELKEKYFDDFEKSN